MVREEVVKCAEIMPRLEKEDMCLSVIEELIGDCEQVFHIGIEPLN